MDLEQACCGFIDLLGLRALHSLPFLEGLAIYEKIVGGTFPFVPGQLAGLNPHVADFNPELYDPHLAFTVISDSLIVRGASVRWPVSLTIQLTQHCMASGIAVRGGLAVGRHHERREGEHLFIFSEAYSRAVALEHIASVPRVILDPDCLAQLKEPFLPTEKRHVPTCVQCEDDLWALNVLPGDYDYGVHGEIVSQVVQHMRPGTPERVRRKWVWLGDYFNALVWGRSGAYEANAPSSFRNFARSISAPAGVVAPTWREESIPEAKFVFLRAPNAGDIFDASFTDNFAVQSM